MAEASAARRQLVGLSKDFVAGDVESPAPGRGGLERAIVECLAAGLCQKVARRVPEGHAALTAAREPNEEGKKRNVRALYQLALEPAMFAEISPESAAYRALPDVVVYSDSVRSSAGRVQLRGVTKIDSKILAPLAPGMCSAPVKQSVLDAPGPYPPALYSCVFVLTARFLFLPFHLSLYSVERRTGRPCSASNAVLWAGAVAAAAAVGARAERIRGRRVAGAFPARQGGRSGASGPVCVRVVAAARGARALQGAGGGTRGAAGGGACSVAGRSDREVARGPVLCEGGG